MLCLELLSVEHHKTKTRLVALVSHYGPRQPSGTNQNSKKMYVGDAKRGKTCATESRLVFVLLLIG